MAENNSSKPEEKPFSVLEKFRLLKKEKEQPQTPVESVKTPEVSGTIFQASTSSHSPSKEEFGREGFRREKGRFSKKRNFNDNTGDRPSKRIAAEQHEGQKELDVGITEFIREGLGFDVIIKQRYTDFHVNEIDLEGNVVKLTSTDIPKEDKESETLSEEEDPSIMSPEKWTQLREIVEKLLSTTVEIDVTDFDKDQRQRIHKAVKRRFGVHVYSNTIDVKDRKVMKIGWASGKDSNHRFCRWPKGRPEYLHFVLHKENVDTSEAINAVGRFSLIKPNKFSYAGTKDKRAVTTQQMCVRRGDVDRFKHCYKLRGISLGNFTYKWSNLRLGDLSGNRFRVALRHVNASDEVIQAAFDHLKSTGFINYFGMQRFGQSALVPTYSIGKAIIRGDWKLAVELVLKPRPGESCYKDVKEAREIWWNTKDANEALAALSRKERTIEGKILCGLKKHGPNAFQNAFDNLPLYLVTMYLHSYQSLIWNKVVSRRVREFGLKVLPGDLIETKENSDQDTKCQENVRDSDDDAENGEEAELKEDCGTRIQVQALSKEESEVATIYDVFYPLPGDDVRLPDNEIAKWYSELLEEDGFSMDSFKKINKKYGMYGSYRKMLERAEDMNWYSVRYSELDQDLLQSDWDVHRGKPPLPLNQEGPYKAVILEFNLKVCCYATMAIRELAKCETSSSSQTLLTNQAREEDETSKRKKVEEQEQKQNMEVESVPDVKKTNDNTGTQNKNCDMEDETAYTESESVPPPQEPNSNVEGEEQKEKNKREAEADNVINKFLDQNYTLLY